MAGRGSLPEGSLFLGFDSSTQSLKATVLNNELAIVASEIVNFDSELPHYKTEGGVYRDSTDDGHIFSPTIMWVEALELLLEKLKPKINFSKVVAISGSGQQHGSVYWKKGSQAVLSSLEPSKSLLLQIKDAFSTMKSPIWMDSSTTKQCREIENAVGGALELAKLTGSRAYERFTGPQIRKIYQTEPNVYEDTERISLVSSFMASILVGCYASIDETDGAGMSLMDINQRTWSNTVLEATAPGLEAKLGNLAPAYATAGQIAPYFVERFQFDKNCLVIQWSGDNPNSLAGLTLNTPGDLAISLGTSDTVFGITAEAKPSLEGHVFPNPVEPDGYMVMLCYKNGSLTREDVRNRCAEKSWDVFNNYLEKTAPLNGGKLGFYYKDHEILPPLPVGFHRYAVENLDDASSDNLIEREVAEFDPPSEVRAIIEGQMLSMRGHAERFGMPNPPKRIIATGGASSNESILKSIAQIFGCPVFTVQRPDSASLGAALRAAHGWLCNAEGSFVPISCLYEGNLEKTSLGSKLAVPAGDKEEDRELLKKRGIRALAAMDGSVGGGGAEGELTAQETALYDRQIRVWGSMPRRGVGSLSLMDDHMVTQDDLNVNFLNPLDESIYGGRSRAEVCCESLKDFNPMVRVSDEKGDPSLIDGEFLDRFDIVVVSGASLKTKLWVVFQVLLVTFSCLKGRDTKNSASCLHFCFQKKPGRETEQQELTYPSLQEAISVPWNNLPRKMTELYFAMRVLENYELSEGRSPGETTLSDTPAVLARMKDMCDKMSLHESKIPSALVERLLAAGKKEHPPVCAILGGILGQEVIKSISCKGDPIKNFFYFDAADGKGVIEDIPTPPPPAN
ncbi:Xylulose kinase [Dichanthelium oligosanthes]|uniref:Xylulose kinase n=1 Tax=Dichanthelium oligosanthes TaxID=888268 RepID=A0A1E5VCJ1_9POAL|nr:Xylulose kinase [Dichanthelium oligosanthes]